MGDEDPLVAALHTAARRYCQERYAHFARVYDQLGGGYDRASRRYSKAALDTFPRYQQLDAFLMAVERRLPAELGSLESARAWLIDLSERVLSPYLANLPDPIADRAVADERVLFARHVASLDEDLLWREPPLPFRRVLADDEAAAWLARVEARYGQLSSRVNRSANPREQVTLYTDWQPLDPDPQHVLPALLATRTPRVFQVNENNVGFELDLALARFGAANYTFSSDLDWLIYVSYETLTIAGEWLVDALYAAAPAWLARRF